MIPRFQLKIHFQNGVQIVTILCAFSTFSHFLPLTTWEPANVRQSYV